MPAKEEKGYLILCCTAGYGRRMRHCDSFDRKIYKEEVIIFTLW